MDNLSQPRFDTHSARISMLSSVDKESLSSASDLLSTSTSASETSGAFSGSSLADESPNRNVEANNSRLKSLSSGETQNQNVKTENSGPGNVLADEPPQQQVKADNTGPEKLSTDKPSNQNVKADNSSLKNPSADESPNQNVVTADNSGLENLLADELVRRREFSQELLQYFNRSAVEGASCGQLMQELQKLDGLIVTLIEQCRSLPQDVDKREKGQILYML